MPVTGPPVSGILLDHADRHAVHVSDTVPPAITHRPDATKECAMGTYEDVFRASTEDPERFWLEAAGFCGYVYAPG